MDYDFYHGITGPEARFSMGHEAFGTWLSHELGSDLEMIAALDNAIADILQHKVSERTIFGHEYYLQLSSDEVVVSANAEGDADLTFDEGFDVYESESYAAAGFEDFVAFYQEWLVFIGASQSC